MNRISVIIPAYEAQDYLVDAIDSVRSQSLVAATPAEVAVEVVVVDDGSSDSTLELAQRWADVAVALHHSGPARARNAGIEAAHGEYLMFLDADDTLRAEALEALYRPFLERPELVAVFGKARDFADDSSTPDATLRARPEAYFGTLPGSAVLRRNVFRALGPFDESLATGETIDWQIRLTDSGLPTLRIESVVLNRRIHAHNTGRNAWEREMASYASILRRRLRAR